MRKAFGILSEVLIDEIEDIRTVMSDHMKVLIACMLALREFDRT